MPQFDIAAFYPQIIYFAGITIGLYVLITKNTLPKLSQNLKINKKLVYVFESLAGVSRDINLLSHIYKPEEILKHLIYKESLSIIFLKKKIVCILSAYIVSRNWAYHATESNRKIKMEKLNRTYLRIIGDSN